MATLYRGRAPTQLPVRTFHLTNLFDLIRTDGITHYLTSHDRPITYRGNTYSPLYGARIGPIRSEQSLRTKTTELSLLFGDGAAAPSLDDVYGRKLDRMRVQAHAFDWRYGEGHIPLYNVFWLLDIDYDDIELHIELGGWTTFLERKLGLIYEVTCQNEFGVNNGVDSFCTVDTTRSTIHVSLTTIEDPSPDYTPTRRKFRLSTAGQPGQFNANHVLNYFAKGFVAFNSGQNSGIRGKISYASARLQVSTHWVVDVELVTAMPFNVNNGDKVSITAGCDKLPLTCKNKWISSGHNSAYDDFRGSEWIPGATAMIRSGKAT